MKNKIDWDKRAKKIVKEYLKKAGVNYIQLEKKLADVGIVDTQINLANKVNRGSFSFSFVLQLLSAIGRDETLLVSNEKLDRKRCKEVTKEEFSKRAFKIYTILNKTENDAIFEELDKAILCLYEAIGMCDEYINYLVNDGNFYYPKEGIVFDETYIDDWYDFVQKENQYMMDAKTISEDLKDA